MLLDELTWPDLDDPGARPRTLLVPVGSTEQHGPHLPLGTDTFVAAAVAAALHDADPELVLAPAIPYGAAGEHEGFPGTVSIGTEALHTLLLEYGRSACRWAARLVLLNGHGGNVAALSSAVRLLRHEGRDAGWLPCAAAVPGVPADAHAGRYETSLLLHLGPGRVRADRAAAGETRPLAEVIDALRAGGTAAVSPNGVLGDPAGATAGEGRTLLAAIVGAATTAIAGWDPDPATGRLRVPR
ncbi:MULTISPECIES: mycofactocin biosynthesis peptidyl-dipeptidase MftE [Pseudonocardia]|uniref:Creatinine amidohydrolase n=2 Tax=Pseudonocardia TaxID=1847 RepID=A0A1Y2NA44_PSEAH|nr:MULTISPECIES: mycofactocin biosynthesis peptidyl-dipeptidase MftE [Pseudonocardia]OSY44101.1 Creatinine amidohydrolase [Pseudonocardia autotrophica]TDN74169.1 creatinine amidohydrolase [Pseudonocardia autotrophica]BBG04929.1 mycofactocin system creatininase family protein [Pseudonocardia autotrophica]GEC23585.1 mycofactocin system creatininase family protein [Pseudonocardia saturnea]